MKLIIGGDFCPENRAEDRLIAEDEIFEKGYRELWDAVDFRILNLEGPITHSTQRINKVGRHIKFNPAILQGIKKMGVDYFSLANNHIMDFGAEGFEDTTKYLKGINIGYFGCSTNKYSILEKGGIKVAMLSFSNNEFSIHSDYKGVGAYGIDIIDLIKTIDEVKKITDKIVVILHTGLSEFPFASPNQRKLCHFLVENGARAVLCQHSHVIGAYEHYKRGFISYGQGSFVFGNKTNTFWNNGYSVELHFNDITNSVKVVPHKQFNDVHKVRLLTKEELTKFESEIRYSNNVIGDADAFQKEWNSYLMVNKKYYFNQFFLPKGKIIRKVLKRVPFLKFVPFHILIIALNCLRNSEHREVLINLLKNEVYKDR